MRYLVASRKHGLHHVGRWLTREVGPANVALISVREQFHDRAWAGMVDRARVPHRRRNQPVGEWVTALPFAAELAAGEAALLTDDPKLSQAAQAAGWPAVFGTLPQTGDTKSPIALGGWWDGSALVSPHWAVRDWGLWPGGLGPAELAAVSLITGPRHPVELLEPHAAGLAAAAFRGLLALDLEWDAAAAGWRSGALRAGWPAFHAPLWLWGQADVGSALLGQPSASPAYLAGAVVSVPPYPFNADRPPVPIVASEAAGPNLVLFDVGLKAGRLQTGGLDGLVALACGRGGTFHAAARAAAATVAGLAVPELQVRPDAGGRTADFVADLEAAGWM